MTIDRDNERILKELARRKFVIFAGNGVTASTKLPSWFILLQQLQNDIGKKNYNREFTEDDSDNFPEIALEIYDVYINVEGDESKGKERYSKTIQKYLTTKEWDYSPSQLNILNVCSKIITTNYDDTFNEAIKDLDRYKFFDVENTPKYRFIVWPDINFIDFHDNSHCIVHLHGNTPDNIIIRKGDYEDYYFTEPFNDESGQCRLRCNILKEFTVIP